MMWTNVTVLLLLCAAVIGKERENMFLGCEEYPNNRRPPPGGCTLLTVDQFRGNKTYLAVAGSVMRLHAHRPPATALQTVFALTRAAFVHPPDSKPTGYYIVEFLTSRSNCTAPEPYSYARCKPVSTWVELICQGMFFLSNGIATYHSSWCTPIR